MQDRLFIIWGGQSPERDPNTMQQLEQRHGSEPDTEVLKRSPCLRCELFTKGRVCPHVKKCSKIDEYQRVAAVHCTLCKYQDVRSMA